MRKRLVSMVLGIIMVVSLVGCGKEAAVSKDVGKESAAETTIGESFEVIAPIESTEEETTPVEVETQELTTQFETDKPVETTTQEQIKESVENIKGTNQLTAEMNDEVEAFKYLSDLEKRIFIKDVSVGGKVSISAWQDSTLYSQDTGIATVDGMIITGVSEGTTYVVAESSLGLRQIYCINVKGQSVEVGTSSENMPLGKNQLTDKMNEEVEVFKYLSEMEQRLNTKNVSVGGKVSISAWLNSTLYSQDTGIALAEGMIITGVSKGTTYVVVESSLGLRQVYKIIVE